MVRILLFGAPGSGKGTQAELLGERYGYVKIATGDLIRNEVKNRSEIGIAVIKIIEDGRLIPDDIIIEMVRKNVDKIVNSPGYIMDGFPRTIDQAKYLSEIQVDKETAIFLKIDESDLIERITERLYCDNCGAIFNRISNPPKSDMTCDICGNKLIKRSDDSKETIKKRINVFKEETEPVISFYRDRGVLKEIEASGSIDGIFREIVGVLS